MRKSREEFYRECLDGSRCAKGIRRDIESAVVVIKNLALRNDEPEKESLIKLFDVIENEIAQAKAEHLD
jgi:hypothetical protein